MKAHSMKFSVIIDALPYLLGAAVTTIWVSLLGVLLGQVIGVVVCVARQSGGRAADMVGGVYVSFFRGVPLLIQLLLIYYMLPLIGIDVPPLVASVAALGLASGAYVSEMLNAISTVQAFSRERMAGREFANSAERTFTTSVDYARVRAMLTAFVMLVVFLVIFAVTIWFFPAYRVFSGIAAIMIALLSLVATNLGGFLLGFLLAMFGGSFAVAWTPRAEYTEDTRRQRRVAARMRTAEAQRQNTETAEPETGGTVALSTATASTDAASPAGADVAAAAVEEQNADTGEQSEPADGVDPEDPEYHRNTEIIEHYTRPDEAAAPPEPAPEEE